ncbi:MAG: rod shape-determining protein MreC [Oscillospiraceae bacterium]|nr:rod shape-determining protein MreC [Oscillospiraceae bacterium]
MKFKVLLCVFALLFGLMLNAALAVDTANFPEAALRTVTQPFARAATSISDWVEDRLDRLVNADRYKNENEQLRRRLAEMYDDIMERDELKQENERLREILGIIEQNEDFTLSPPCAVIAREALGTSANFIINKGSNSGIKAGDPVITEIGLVGRIIEVAPTYSKVTTILSAEIHVAVRTASNGTAGIINNDILYSDNGLCLMDYIEIGSEIGVGDAIVTLGGTGIFPPGLFVGTVTDVFPADSGLLLNAVVEPSEDLFKITDVFVITSFEGQGVLP